jgi:hypothetical protein
LKLLRNEVKEIIEKSPKKKDSRIIFGDHTDGGDMTKKVLKFDFTSQGVGPGGTGSVRGGG